MDTMPVIEGRHIRLRPLRASDVDALYALHGDPQVMRYWSTTAWTSTDDAIEHLRRSGEAYAGGALPWAIAMAESDELIGDVSVFNISQAHRRAELGYSLAAGHWGRGLAVEAVRLALAYGFDTLKLERFEADTDPRNAPSRRMLEKLGFELEGTMRRRWFVGGEWCDSSWYGLLRDQFVC
jgi:ribosomal-protein-alanine N-acetyltransferase